MSPISDNLRHSVCWSVHLVISPHPAYPFVHLAHAQCLITYIMSTISGTYVHYSIHSVGWIALRDTELWPMRLTNFVMPLMPLSNPFGMAFAIAIFMPVCDKQDFFYRLPIYGIRSDKLRQGWCCVLQY